MKKFFVLLMVFVLGIGTTYAQRMEERSRIRIERRAEAALLDSLKYEEAIVAVNERKFVIEATRIVLDKGATRYVSSTTNFVSVNGDKAVVQVASNGPYSGANGLGGITVDGNISSYKYSKNKKGVVTITMNVMGRGISAQLRIVLREGSASASVSVEPNFSSKSISLEGVLVPLDQSSVFQGMSL